MRLAELASIVHGRLSGNDAEFSSVNTDTRNLQAGELFVALKGARFDGHGFLQQASELGAAGALVQVAGANILPQVVVEDTVKALGKWAAWQRRQIQVPVIGITGSCGKTTARNMTARVLAEAGEVLVAQKSFNNHIGLPLTLLRWCEEDRYVVLELGANHFGEIDYLTHIAQPDIAVITNAAPCHLEGFGSVAGVARAKGEIFKGLAADGVAILNRDDEHYETWRQMLQNRRILTFGHHAAADIRAENVVLDSNSRAIFDLVTPRGRIAICLPLLGKHNVMNALVAAAVAHAVDCPLELVQRGLKAVQPEKRRLVELKGFAGAQIIDDSYNASPVAVKSSLDILAGRPGEKLFVMGAMGELGEHAADYHLEIGRYAKRLGIRRLYGYGELSQSAVKGFGEGGYYFPTHEALIEAVKKELSPQTIVLVKGSLSMQMDKVVAALRSD